MFASQIVFDSAATQVRAGEGVRSRALLRDDADVSGSIDKNSVACKQLIAFIETWAEGIEEFFKLGNEILREIADLPAHACVGGGETRAGQQLEKVIKFFALGKRVEEDRHCTEIESHRPETEQVRGDARGFAANGADCFSTRWNFPAHQFFYSERVSNII